MILALKRIFIASTSTAMICLLIGSSLIYGEPTPLNQKDGLHRHDHVHKKRSTKKQKEVEYINPKEYGVMAIFADGLVCSFCAYAIEKNVKKLPFIDKKKFKKGVVVSLKKALLKLHYCKKNKNINIQKAMDAIQKGSYFPKTISFLLKGVLLRERKNWIVKDHWLQKSFFITNTKEKWNAYRSKTVQIKGTVSVEKNAKLKEPYHLQVVGIELLQ